MQKTNAQRSLAHQPHASSEVSLPLSRQLLGPKSRPPSLNSGSVSLDSRPYSILSSRFHSILFSQCSMNARRSLAHLPLCPKSHFPRSAATMSEVTLHIAQQPLSLKSCPALALWLTVSLALAQQPLRLNSRWAAAQNYIALCCSTEL